MSISVESLAGGKSHNGLPTFVKQIDLKKEAVRLHVKGEGNHCTCHNVALIILALLTTAGAASLIALSGGPTNFSYFAPGIALIFPTAAMIIWITGSVIEGMCVEQALHEEWENAKKPKIFYADVLTEMRKDEVTDEHICNSMAAWKPKHQTAFRKFVRENTNFTKYRDAETQTLNENYKKYFDGDSKILTAFCKFDGVHIEDPLEPRDEEFLKQWRLKELWRAFGGE